MDITSFLTVINPLLEYGFLRRALFAGIFIALACAVLGVFLILRRESMIGHGLAHTAFAGVAVGLLLNLFPIYFALFFAVITALIIVKIKDKAGLYSDTGIATASSVGFAVGVIIASLAQSFNVDLFSFLFGEILAIEMSEVILSVLLAISVIAVIFLNYHRFLYMTFDRESAKASGVKVDKLDALLTIMTAVTVVLGMKVVGVILVSALVVIPSASGLQLAKNFKGAMFLAMINSLISVLLGLMCAYYLDIPASGSIVVISFLIFGVFALIRNVRSRTN